MGFDSGLAKSVHSTTGLRIRIPCSDYDLPDTGIDERIDAGRSLAMMAAWFEGDMNDRITRGCSGPLHGDDFGVTPAESLMMCRCQNRSR